MIEEWNCFSSAYLSCLLANAPVDLEFSAVLFLLKHAPFSFSISVVLFIEVKNRG